MAEEAFVWVLTLPYAAEVVGSVTMIAGFGAAVIAVRRRATGDPTA